MKVRAITIALGAALVLGACGGGGDDSGVAQAGDSEPAAASVTMTDHAFDPANLSVGAGELEMTNEGEALHNLTIEGTDFDQDVQAGETETEDLELEPGEYAIFCKYHRGQGMEGTLTITG